MNVNKAKDISPISTQLSENKAQKNTEKENISVFQPKIAVIDDFTGKTIDIDGDKKKDISHGEIVVQMLKKKTPNAEIIKCDAYDKANNNIPNQKIMDCYKEILKRINNNEKIDAVNMSLSIDANGAQYDKLIKENKNFEEIKTTLRSNLTKECDNDTSLMEEITKKGVPIYVAAGNDYEKQVNIFVLGKGVHSVCAADDAGKTLPTFSTMCNKSAQGFTPINVLKDNKGKPLYDSKGDLLFDVNEDGKADYTSKDMANPFYLKDKFKNNPKTPGNVNVVFGSSFASPTRLAEDLSAERKKQQATQ